MKKIIMSIVLGLYFTGTFAQDRIHLGVKGGITASDIYYNESVVSDPKFGFSGGAFLSIPIGKFLGIQPEAIYTQRAIVLKGSAYGDSYSVTRTTSSLDIPLFFQLRPVKFITIVGGPQYSVFLGKTDRFDNGRITEEQKQQIINSGLRNGTLGVATGIDINIGVLVLSGRMGWDLQSTTISAGKYTYHYNNKWAQAMIGIRI